MLANDLPRDVRRADPSADSVFRERLFEHQLIADLMRYAWRHDGAALEVSQPAIDRTGHDLVLEARGFVRHVQLKTSWTAGKTAEQNVHLGLAAKQSGCIVWMRIDEDSMTCDGYLFFGGAPGQALPGIDELKVARRTVKGEGGVRRERPNVRTVPRAKFMPLGDIPALYRALFGEGATSA